MTDSDEFIDEILDYREQRWAEIMDQQFDLVYFGHFIYEDTQKMAPVEREYFYDRLVRRKEFEKEERES